MQKSTYTYLALGDSYTVGEGISEENNFPKQVVRFLRNKGYHFEDPRIIAKTGWTTTELWYAISNSQLLAEYSVVSLLIGVNDQYRGGTTTDYNDQFEKLLQKAIRSAGNRSGRVFVLSIPDWSVTPFAEGRNRTLISQEIDSFNKINHSISQKWKVNYIDITQGSREAIEDPALVAKDGLHPSAKEYRKWAEKLAAAIKEEIK